MAGISKETKSFVDGVAAEAVLIETPCGDGTMVWRIWGAGPPLVLFHGGYGSWTHWIRNVLPLSRAFTVIAPDLPGLGESATPPEPHTAEGLARILVEGLDIVAAAPRAAASRRVFVRRRVGRACRGPARRPGAGLYRRRLERARPDPPADRSAARPSRCLGRGSARRPSSQSRRADDRRSGEDRRARGLRPIDRTRRAAGSGAAGSRARTRWCGLCRSSRHGSTASGAGATPPPIRISTSAPEPCARFNPRRVSKSSTAPATGCNTRPPTSSTRFSPKSSRNTGGNRHDHREQHVARRQGRGRDRRQQRHRGGERAALRGGRGAGRRRLQQGRRARRRGDRRIARRRPPGDASAARGHRPDPQGGGRGPGRNSAAPTSSSIPPASPGWCRTTISKRSTTI